MKGSVRRKDKRIGTSSQNSKESGNEYCFHHDEKAYTHTHARIMEYTFLERKRDLYITVTRRLIVQIKIYGWSKLQQV